MGYADEFGQRLCRRCGTPFTLSAAQSIYYRQPGRHLPVRCEDCRRVRRAKKDAQKARQGDQGGTGPSQVTDALNLPSHVVGKAAGQAWRWSVYTSGFFGKDER